MTEFQYMLLIILIVSAAILIAAVVFTKSNLFMLK